MLAGEVPQPSDLGGWAAEVKWDGMRLLTHIDARGEVTVQARSGADATARYPELASLAGLVDDAPVVLDGEVVALDPAGLPSFSRLQQRMMLAGPPGSGPHAYGPPSRSCSSTSWFTTARR